MFETKNKTEIIQFRATAEEKEKLREVAKQNECSISNLIKFCIKNQLEELELGFTRAELLLIEEMTECEIADRKEKNEFDFYNKDREDLLNILRKIKLQKM